MAKKNETEDKREATDGDKPLTTSEQILDKITKKFIFRGKPFRVKSRHGIRYEWMTDKRFKNNYEIDRFILDFIAFEMPEVRSKYQFDTTEKVLSGILDMLDEYGGKTTNGLKKRITKKPEDAIPQVRTRESLSVDEATKEVNEKYDVDLAADGTFLIFTNRRCNETEPPLGGLGPLYRVCQIIEYELKYAQPEFSLILGVAQNLYDKAVQKKEKPYLFSEKEKQKVEDEIVCSAHDGERNK